MIYVIRETFDVFWSTVSGNRAPSAILLGLTDITFAGVIDFGVKFADMGGEINLFIV